MKVHVLLFCIFILPISNAYPISKVPHEGFCDEEIYVEWIDREKKIGQASYTLWSQRGSARAVKSILHLDEKYPYVSYRALEKKGNLSIAEQIKIIKEWDLLPVFPGQNRSLIFRSKKGEEFVIDAFSHDHDESYSRHQLNVCIAYPEGGRQLIVEVKKDPGLDRAKNKQEIANSLRVSHDAINSASLRVFHDMAFDVNYDGKTDYLLPGFYSYGGGYYKLIQLWVNDDSKNIGEYLYKPTGRRCTQYPIDAFFLVLEGSDFYINGKCNITELTGKE